jgi:hypothetical protein
MVNMDKVQIEVENKIKKVINKKIGKFEAKLANKEFE